MRNVTVNNSFSAIVLLTDRDDFVTPKTGVTYSEVVVEYFKNGATSFTNKDLAANLGVASVTIDNAGATYSAGSLVFTGGSGSGAAGTYTVSGGVINTTIVTNAGKNYISAPSVSPSDAGDGTAVLTSVLQANDWFDMTGGAYELTFNSSEIDTLGKFVYRVSGTDLNTFVGEVDVVVAGDTISNTDLDTCTLWGHVSDLNNNGKAGLAVYIKPLAPPTLVGRVGVTSETISTTTDSNGYFTLSAARLVLVEISIPAIDYTIVATIPNLPSVNLFSLP